MPPPLTGLAPTSSRCPLPSPDWLPLRPDAPSPHPIGSQVGIERATGIVWNITGGSDLTLFEVNQAAEIIYDLVDPEVCRGGPEGIWRGFIGGLEGVWRGSGGGPEGVRRGSSVEVCFRFICVTYPPLRSTTLP
eukprot:357671-Prorocentrum_minimum.AAC.1